jgi:hypothetical protein
MIWYARREHIFLLERFWTPSLSVTNNTAFIRVSHYRIHSLLKWKTISWAAWAPWASVWITWNEVSWTCWDFGSFKTKIIGNSPLRLELTLVSYSYLLQVSRTWWVKQVWKLPT